jgi:hypothetical protein
MWNKDSEKKMSNSGTKFVPFKIYLVHRRSLEKIRTTFDTIPVFLAEIGNRVIIIVFSITITITITLIVCNCNSVRFF